MAYDLIFIHNFNILYLLKVKLIGVIYVLNNSAFIGFFFWEEFAVEGRTEQALSSTLRPLGYLTEN